MKVVEYRKTQLHGKAAVIDDEWTMGGAGNWDCLSLLVHQEANVAIKNTKFAQNLRLHIERGVADGMPIRLEDFVNIRWHERL